MASKPLNHAANLPLWGNFPAVVLSGLLLHRRVVLSALESITKSFHLHTQCMMHACRTSCNADRVVWSVGLCEIIKAV